MEAPGISRRQLLQVAAAAAAIPAFGWLTPLLPRTKHRAKRMIALDLDPDQMHRRTQEILDWVQFYRPQTNTRKRPWDPRRPDDPRNERLLGSDYAKTVKASELSLVVPNSYGKARQVITGIRKLQAAADARGVRVPLDSMLYTGLQAHTVSFDHPDLGVVVPEGWRWEWTLRVPAAVAERQRRAWVAAGWRLEEKPGVALARQRIADGGQPTGWLRAEPRTRRAIQYTIMPDLRDPACRGWLVERFRGVLAETRLRCLDVSLKSGWLHGNASILNIPARALGAAPWLPSPYPGDSYRDACDALVRELAAALGPDFSIAATNTGVPPPGSDPQLPGYVRTRHGGLADGPAAGVLYGYWTTILRLPAES